MLDTIPSSKSLSPSAVIASEAQAETLVCLGKSERNKFLKRIITASVFIAGCVALKPFTPLLAFVYFLCLYCQRRPSTVDLLALWLVVSPLMGPYFLMEVGGLPAFRFHWFYLALVLISLSREKARSPIRFPSNSLDKSILFYGCVCLISITISVMYRTPLRTFLDAMVVPLAFYMVAKHCIGKPDFLPKIYLAAILGIFAFGMLGLYEALTQHNLLDYGETEWDVFRVNGPMHMAEDYGICMNMLLVFCLSMKVLVKSRLIRGSQRYFTYIVGILAVVFTFTRGIWLSLTTSSLVLFARRRTMAFLMVVPVVALLAWGALDLVLPQLSGDIWEKRVTNQKTINARFATYKSALAMFRDHPVLGVGFAAFGEVQERNTKYQTEYNGEPSVDTPHNYFLSIVSETGFLGLCGALLMLAHTVRFSLRLSSEAHSPLQRNYGEAMVAITVAYLVAGLGNDFTRNIDFVNKYFFFFLGGLSGLVDSLRWHKVGIHPELSVIGGDGATPASSRAGGILET